MNVLGIIAEYNPFHLGHAYQIETLRKKTKADYVIIAMSGNFVQRGAPALVDKFTRTRMALECGADLILELPVLYATASAENFAKGGVSLLHKTGVVTHLGFGAESDNLPILQEISDILLQNPLVFQDKLQQELRSGLSFPAARAKALEAVFSSMDSTRSLGTLENFTLEQIHEILASPNNILAIEYLKALSSIGSTISPCLLLRKGQGYHDIALSNGFCSASAIRNRLRKDKKALTDKSFLTSAMPEAAGTLLSDYPYSFLCEDDFSQLVSYRLLTEPLTSLSNYADFSPELANRMNHARYSFMSWTQFCELLKTKNTTYTRISRLLLHLLLNIKATDYAVFQNPNPVSYLRVLGFRKSAAPLLSAIKESGQAPLFTSVSEAEKNFSAASFTNLEEVLSCLEMDIAASDIYNLVLQTREDKKTGCPAPLSDYRHPVAVL